MNVNLTFKSTELPVDGQTLEIKNAQMKVFKHELYTTDNITFTFVLISCTIDLQNADFNVKNKCGYSGYVRLKFKDGSLPPTKDALYLSSTTVAFKTNSTVKSSTIAGHGKDVDGAKVQEQQPITTAENSQASVTNPSTSKTSATVVKDVEKATTHSHQPSQTDRNQQPKYTYPSTAGKVLTTVVKDDITNTAKRQPISNDAVTHITDHSVLSASDAQDGMQIVIIAVVCSVSVLIIVTAVVIAVVCVKRKRRPVGKLNMTIETV
ncbi:hypothetical protein DPMN_148009 [Dreissena polymorpha]|uniref:Uncharacterized protein n=1 Tax=Dreissena polymorpha TaxID=45954 RepID=A0A9D4FER1_DREPO|nr:hypothetical protein DPMN_148009 [Dreissena polymorpha]